MAHYQSEDDSSDFSEEEEEVNVAVNKSKMQATNMFANDGSFLEMFKKKMEEQQSITHVATTTTGHERRKNDAPKDHAESSTFVQGSTLVQGSTDDDTGGITQSQQEKKPSLQSFVGKRRGGKVLPTGMVKKIRKEGDQKLASKDDDKVEGRTDAWSQYMAEVRKYKERSCEDEGKTRPLVK